MASRPRPRTPSLVEHFDEHILQVIMDELDDWDRRSWRLVCKTAYRLDVRNRTRIRLLKAELLGSVLRKYHVLESLDLSLCIGVTNDILIRVGELAGSRPLSIKMARLRDLDSFTVLNLTSQCPYLVEVDISYCTSLEDAALVGLGQLAALEKLSLIGCCRITDQSIGCVAAGCKLLRLLVLKGCIGISDLTLRLLSINCKKLTLLDLTYTKVTDKGVEFLMQLDFLTSLTLSSNNVGNKSLAYQTSSKSLRELDISGCINISEVTFSDSNLESLNLSRCTGLTEAGMLVFKRSNALRSLKLDCCELTTEALGYVATGCKQLKELSLSKCRGISDDAIAALLPAFRTMWKLDLTCCSDLTEESLVVISTSCPALRILKAESCPMVTDRSLPVLWQCCTLLKEVDLTDNSVTDTGLEFITSCPWLEIIKLAFCSLRDYGISRIAVSCKKLNYLDLYRCTGVGDLGVSVVADGCKNLSVLNLSYCSLISDTSMAFISRLNQLRQLELRGCSLITSEGLKRVAMGCKHLLELDLKRCTSIDDSGAFALEHYSLYLAQVNVSYCPLTDAGMMALARLGCMQNIKLVHLRYVSVDCLGSALLQSGCLRKVKLLSFLKTSLPSCVVQALETRGCRLRWVDKPL